MAWPDEVQYAKDSSGNVVGLGGPNNTIIRTASVALADLPLPADYSGFIRVHDLGVGGATLFSNGVTWRSMHTILIAGSAVPVTHTGDTTQTTLATISIPPALGLNGRLRVSGKLDKNAEGHILYLRYGGVQVLGAGLTGANKSEYFEYELCNRNSTSVQVGGNNTKVLTGASGSGWSTHAINTAIAQDFLIRIQLAGTGSGSATLMQYAVELDML
jgi:hypothetical protein